MRHPAAIAILATSTTVLVAALCEMRTSLFFLAFGVVCFALATLVRSAELTDAGGPLICVITGAVQLAAFGTLRDARPADPVLIALAALGSTYLILGTVAWLRARTS